MAPVIRAGLRVTIPDGSIGSVQPAPWGDWLAPDKITAQVGASPVIHVEWATAWGPACGWIRPWMLRAGGLPLGQAPAGTSNVPAFSFKRVSR